MAKETKPVMTLREYIRVCVNSDDFSATQVHGGYKKIKPATTIETVRTQLCQLASEGELKKIKSGNAIKYVKVANSGGIRQFDALLRTAKINSVKE